MIDARQFNGEVQGLSAQEVYQRALQRRSFDEDLVFTHGDYCLPHMLLDRQRSQVRGLIDWGHAGMADRSNDRALAARSRARNFGAQWVPLLFTEYGLASRDQVKSSCNATARWLNVLSRMELLFLLHSHATFSGRDRCASEEQPK